MLIDGMSVRGKRFTPITLLPALLALALLGCGAHAGENPVEIGLVDWGRDFDAALQAGGDSGKPVFLLFQEVPGCSGCKAFGSQVLSNPLVVEAIEDEFIPVVVYNNRSGGPDAELLARYGEPAWNYQVVRFLDAAGRDLIPRRDRVWDTGGIAARMIEALQAAKRPVPRYLEVLAAENDTDHHAVGAFAMHCFWTGEQRLGRLDGVISTEAGWLEGREVTRVVYRRDRLTLEQLAAAAAGAGCADKVFAPGGEAEALEGFTTGPLTSSYRPAKPSDQKRQLSQWKALDRVTGLTPMQLTRLNALAPVDRKLALEWLSPRQRAQLRQAEE